MANIIDMPKLSDTMTVGTLVKWLKPEGAVVKSGDMLAEVETDKATMELESFFDGTLLKIFVEAGAQVAIGDPLCAVGQPGEKVEAPAPKSAAPAAAPATGAAEAPATPPAAPKAAEAKPAAPPPAAQPTPAPEPAPAPTGGRIKISPLARKLAAEKGIDPACVTGSGPGGRIVRADILAAEKNPAAKAGAAFSGGTPARVTGSGPGGRIVRADILAAEKNPAAKAGAAFSGGTPARTGPIQEERVAPVSNMRGTIARRLVEAKTTIPHFQLDIEIDADPLLTLRAQLNTGLEGEGVKLSVNDFILKASAEALRKVPAVNASWQAAPVDGSGPPSIRYHGAAHVSFAVAIEDGLITPVIRDTHTKSVFAISTEAKALGKRAKNKKLAPAEYTGGTFCVSNLGMMGVTKFNAIINPPNAAILAVGTTVNKPVVKHGQIVVGNTLTLTLSCDHRVVDGAVGAQYLAALRQLLEAPALLLV